MEVQGSGFQNHGERAPTWLYGRYRYDGPTGASPRAMLALMRASQAKAFLQGRNYVKPDDVKAVAVQVLLHRLVLSSEARMQQSGGEGILRSLIYKVNVPVD